MRIMGQTAENPVNAHDIGMAVLPQTVASRDGANAPSRPPALLSPGSRVCGGENFGR